MLNIEQSRLNSRCPSLFALELKRLPGEVTSVAQGLLDTLTDKATPADLTLFCEHPGEQHPVKTYTIQPPGRNLAKLAPLMKRANTVLSVVAPMIALQYPGFKVPNMKDLADFWTDKLSGPLGLIDETRDPRHAYGAPLVALRQILMEVAKNEEDRWGNLSQVLALKSQYLWVCEDHREHKDYQG